MISYNWELNDQYSFMIFTDHDFDFQVLPISEIPQNPYII